MGEGSQILVGLFWFFVVCLGFFILFCFGFGFVVLSLKSQVEVTMKKLF